MDYILDKIKNYLSGFMDKSVVDRISTPPSHIEADLAIPMESEREAKNLKKELEDNEFKFISSFTTARNFLNIELNKENVYHYVLNNVLDLGLGFGATDKNNAKFAFIEYSSPNIAKPIGVGHLRSTIIGESLARIYETTGFEVWRENFLGDWGTPFGKVLVAYDKWGNEEMLKEDPLRNLKDLYVKFGKEVKKDESLMDQAREVFNKLEKGDEEVVEMWNKFKNISLEEYRKVYDNLGIEFDNFSGESNAADQAHKEIDLCLEKGICHEGEEGAIVVEGLDNLPLFLLRKEDGSTLYCARDLAELKKRVKKHKPDEILYVVGNEQELYFKQLFALADSMGYLNNTKLRHISFGMVMVDGKPMSTRKGTLIELDELFEKAIKKARKLVEDKNPELDDEIKDAVAKDVGIGSIIYNDLGQQRSKNISFDWDKMLDFNAGSGPYLQYTYARIKSILRNILGPETDFHNDLIDESNELSFTFKEKVEFEVVQDIMKFPDIILSAAQNQSPHIICNYLESLSSDFNSFYSNVSIKDTDAKDLKISRLVLAFAVSQVIKKGLHLLNIKAPERM